MNHHLIALGKMKKGPLRDLFDDYNKRLSPPLTLRELEYKKSSSQLKEEEGHLILNAIPEGSYVIALDERGDTFTSPEWAGLFKNIQINSGASITWIIGGADGLSDAVRSKSHRLLSFGKNTWPHMMVRVMLVEQLYRAQQILKGHPYHRE